MNEIMHSFAPLTASATGALLSAMWEGAVLTALVTLCLRFLPRLSAAARSVIWLNVFLLVALLHLVPVFTHSGVQLARVSAVHLDPRWSLAVGALWLALSAWRASQLVIGAMHLNRLARRAVPVEATPELQPVLQDVPGGRSVELCVSEEIARPSVLGFFRPRILVPPALLEKLSPSELEQVVVHEMEHLRRGDDWTNLLQKIGIVLFPLNPVLLWVERRLCMERELACDDRVMQHGSGRKAYALCLTRLAEFSMLHRGFSLVLGALERRPELVRRVERILSCPVQTMSRRAALVTTGGLLSGALGCALALAHSPQLVSFAPTISPLQAKGLEANVRGLEPMDLREMSRELGGTPQMVKAVIPPATTHSRSTRTAVIKRPLHRRAPAPSRIARLTPPELQPKPQQQLLVMTEWSDVAPAPSVVISVFRDQQGPVVVPARYAVVSTPAGWLILQI